MFNEQGINAAVLTHVIDTHFISFIEYKEQGIKFARIDSEIGSTLKSGETDGDSHQITDKFKQFISNGDVTVTAEKLKNADLPAVMLLSESSRRMQDMSKLYGDMFGAGAKPEISVVLNLENDIVKAIPSLPEDQAKLVCQHIFDLAQLSHKPLSADEMAGFISRSVKILGIAAVQK
jgi:molecular chaperone HtpG